MSTEERDTHFAGFAKLLWDELVRANSHGYIDVNIDDDPIDPTDYLTLIARRAYDLAIYLYEFVPQLKAMYPDVLTVQDVIKYIPDLTSWPPIE